VLVLHERKSRVTLAARLTGKTAETISAMLAVFGRIDPHLRRSITFDNDPQRWMDPNPGLLGRPFAGKPK
jgi:IS30 family transposase